MPEYDVIVIGAGQAGLAAGHALRTTGLSFTLLEAGEQPGGSWPRFYDSLTLFSPARYCALPCLPFPGDPARYPHRDEATAYLRQYADHFALPVRTGSRVAAVHRHADGLVVELTGGEQLTTRAVITATGLFGAPQVPDLPGMETYTGELLHTAAKASSSLYRASTSNCRFRPRLPIRTQPTPRPTAASCHQPGAAQHARPPTLMFLGNGRGMGLVDDTSAAAAIAAALDQVGSRLRRLRTQRRITLTGLAATTGISKSTLSRLETGQWRPTLELLLALSHAYRVPLDDLVAAPEVGDPRIQLSSAASRDGR